MCNEINIKFSEDLQNFLVKNLATESEEVCRKASCSLIMESIEVMYQNAPNKENFREVYLQIVDRIITIWEGNSKE